VVAARYPVEVPPAEARIPDMWGQLPCLPVLGDALADGLAAVADHDCGVCAADDEFVEALAMVRLNARVAPRAAAPAAVPISGLVILTLNSLSRLPGDGGCRPGRVPATR
jgi:hypothetical protein